MSNSETGKKESLQFNNRTNAIRRPWFETWVSERNKAVLLKKSCFVSRVDFIWQREKAESRPFPQRGFCDENSHARATAPVSAAAGCAHSMHTARSKSHLVRWGD